MNTIRTKPKEVKQNLLNQTNFLDEQIEFHQTKSEEFKDDSNPYRHAKHKEVASSFQDLKHKLIALDQEVTSLKDKIESKTISNRPVLSLTKEDLEGIPEEQLEELSISSADKAEFIILSMLEESGGIMSLDQIIVGLFRETGEIHKRTTVTARLYRMAQKDMLYPVPLKKGVYSLGVITEEEAENIFRGGTS